MGLNESKGQMYEWINFTWNTIKGACPHDCSYCYMKRWGKLNPVRFDEKELKTDLGSGNFIFVGSSCDMFANDIPKEWIKNILNHCKKYNNKYLFQTKDVINMFQYYDDMPTKSAFCTTIETNRFYPEIMTNSPAPVDRVDSRLHYVTCEPIIDFDLSELVTLIKKCSPFQVNIGGNTSKIKLPEPSKEQILELIAELEKFTKIKLKKNLNRLLK